MIEINIAFGVVIIFFVFFGILLHLKNKGKVTDYADYVYQLNTDEYLIDKATNTLSAAYPEDKIEVYSSETNNFLTPEELRKYDLSIPVIWSSSGSGSSYGYNLPPQIPNEIMCEYCLTIHTSIGKGRCTSCGAPFLMRAR